MIESVFLAVALALPQVQRDSFELSSAKLKAHSQYRFLCSDEKGVAVEVLKTLSDVRKIHTGTGSEVVIRTRTEQGGRLNNAKDRELWQIFSLSFIRREDREQFQDGEVLGDVHPTRFAVGDHYHYQFKETNRARSGGAKSQVIWDVDLHFKPIEEMQWGLGKEKVFVVEEIRKAKSRADEFLTTYYSARLNTDLRTRFRAVGSWEYDCRLISQK